jgi:hypothetical protein
LGCQAPQVMNSCNETLCLSSNRKWNSRSGEG